METNNSKMGKKAIVGNSIDFLTWLSSLLSLTGETSAERLKVVFPAIKEYILQSGIEDTKIMFELYTDNKLAITPIPNYFDRILFGKIVTAYRQQKKPIKKETTIEELSDEEKELLAYESVINCFEDFKQMNRVADGYAHIYDYLNTLKVIDFSLKEKNRQMEIARDRLLEECKNECNVSKYRELSFRFSVNPRDGAIIAKAKKMLLERFFLTIIAKNENIKKYL